MKRLIRFLLSVIAVFIFSYLMEAFVEGNINCLAWGYSSRDTVAFFTTFGAVIFGVIILLLRAHDI